MPNPYQKRKARLIAATLIMAACASDTPLSTLPRMAAMMTHQQWISVSLQAGVPVADLEARVMVVALLEGMAA